jgi:LysR family transcriptional activator of nhaA
VPTVMEGEVAADAELRLVGRARDVRERFYAITLEERPSHPGVAAICQPPRRARRPR